jgi:hypothetical protein
MAATKLMGLVVLTVGLALAGSAPLQAADTHPVKLPCVMVISGVDLLPGDYNLHWELQGPRGTVKFSRHGHVIATVQGVVSKLDETTPRDTLYFHKHPDGFIAITALALGGTDMDIVFRLTPERHRQSSNPRMNNRAVDDDLSSPHFGRPMSGR